MEKEESIDLREILQIILEYKQKLIIIVVVCTALAMITAFFILPKTYESTSLVRAKSVQNGLSAAAGAMAALGMGGGASSPIMGYQEMMKSRYVVEPIIAGIDLPEEKKEKLTVKNFVKSNIDISNAKGTDLIEITGTGRTPEEAQMITLGIVNGFQKMMTELNQSQQSAMIKFLSDRMVVAKDEMDKAETEMEAYRQATGIYRPDEQEKAVMDQLMAYDKSVSEIMVGNETRRVKLQGVTEQLNKQKMALIEFNIVDNESIQKIRDAIIAKQMGLVELGQRYTEAHPSVILLKKEIEELNGKLRQEVQQSVQAETSTLNPIHAGLLQEKVEAETGIMVGEASVAAMQKLKNTAEADISKLSKESMEYIKLQRKQGIATEIYMMLVKNYEQTRIQEAMDSMDIQVIDAADLPDVDKPAGPRKLLITAIGGILGLMLAFGYTLILYNRRNSSSKLSV